MGQTLAYKQLDSLIKGDTSLSILNQFFEQIEYPLDSSNYKIDTETGDTLITDNSAVQVNDFWFYDINNDGYKDLFFYERVIPHISLQLYLNKNGVHHHIYGTFEYISDNIISNIINHDTTISIFIYNKQYMLEEFHEISSYSIKKNGDSLRYNWTMIFPYDLKLCEQQTMSKTFIITNSSSILRKEPHYKKKIENFYNIYTKESEHSLENNKIVHYHKNATGISLAEITDSLGQTWCFVVMDLTSKPFNYECGYWKFDSQWKIKINYPKNNNEIYYIGWIPKNDIHYS